MLRIHTILLSILITGNVTALAQSQEGQPVNEDLELGRRYLQCTGFWGMSAPMLKALGQQVDPVKLKKLRDMNELAAYTLMGDEAAKAENSVQKMKFVNEMKSMGASKALDNWSASCSRLVEETFPKIEQRVIAYAKSKQDNPTPPAGESSSR